MNSNFFTAALIILASAALSSCGKKNASSTDSGAAPDKNSIEAAVETSESEAAPRSESKNGGEKALDADPFTYANYQDVRVKHVDLDLDVLFDEKVLDGSAILSFDRLSAGADALILDTNDLEIKSVEVRSGDQWTGAPYELGDDDPVLGARLEISLPDDAEQVKIEYRTSPQAAGLQWLSPAQTAGKTHPFMYSQAQALNARSMAPLQDTPAVRITYSATLRTPPELLAVMSAQQDPENERDGEYHFEMPQPIPSYLIAVAVGDLAFKPISDHMGVYAEEYILDAAAEEFADTPDMEKSNAALYGPYRWGRYDMIVLPPSFPYGGMENPRLSFLTPTLVAGDKSLTNVVAHELAHSWSGNLVTNATWRDAWLNEGFTSYVENRVMEDLYGAPRAVMEQALSLEDLKRDVAEAERPELTALKLPADLAHPDDAFTQVAYVKGQFFLMFLEERFGRDPFDAFLKNYFDHFAFQSVTTEDFLDYLSEHLWSENPDALTQDEIDAWVYGPGIPETAAKPKSDAFEKVAGQQNSWLTGSIKAEEIETKNWSTHEWLHFLNTLPDAMTVEQFAALDAAFELSTSANAETAYAWYMKTIKGGYVPARPELEKFLMRVGRGKFIYRLYAALEESDQRDWAMSVFENARPGYHPIAQRRIDEIFAE